MLIKIRAEKRKFTIPIPLMIVFMFPGVATKFIKDELGNDMANVSDKQLKFAIKNMRHALKHSKHILKAERLPLIDVKSSNGETVQIFL